MGGGGWVEKEEGVKEVVIKKVEGMIEGREGGVMERIKGVVSEGGMGEDLMGGMGVREGRKEGGVMCLKGEGRVEMGMGEGKLKVEGKGIREIWEKMGIGGK